MNFRILKSLAVLLLAVLLAEGHSYALSYGDRPAVSPFSDVASLFESQTLAMPLESGHRVIVGEPRIVPAGFPLKGREKNPYKPTVTIIHQTPADLKQALELHASGGLRVSYERDTVERDTVHGYLPSGVMFGLPMDVYFRYEKGSIVNITFSLGYSEDFSPGSVEAVGYYQNGDILVIVRDEDYRKEMRTIQTGHGGIAGLKVISVSKAEADYQDLSRNYHIQFHVSANNPAVQGIRNIVEALAVHPELFTIEYSDGNRTQIKRTIHGTGIRYEPFSASLDDSPYLSENQPRGVVKLIHRTRDSIDFTPWMDITFSFFYTAEQGSYLVVRREYKDLLNRQKPAEEIRIEGPKDNRPSVEKVSWTSQLGPYQRRYGDRVYHYDLGIYLPKEYADALAQAGWDHGNGYPPYPFNGNWHYWDQLNWRILPAEAPILDAHTPTQQPHRENHPVLTAL